jgi:hypothetical protein
MNKQEIIDELKSISELSQINALIEKFENDRAENSKFESVIKNIILLRTKLFIKNEKKIKEDMIDIIGELTILLRKYISNEKFSEIAKDYYDRLKNVPELFIDNIGSEINEIR